MPFARALTLLAALSLFACTGNVSRADASMVPDDAVSTADATDSPWSAQWPTDAQMPVFTASFNTQPRTATTLDQPRVDFVPGADLTNQMFTYTRDEAGAHTDGAVTIRFDRDAVRIEASANARSTGDEGVDLHAGFGGFTLCYRALPATATVRFVGDVTFVSPMNVSGGTGTAAYEMRIADVFCLGGLGELGPDGGAPQALGNGQTRCTADVPVGADGLACLRGDFGFGVEANASMLLAFTGSGSVDAVMTITATVP